MRLDENEVTQVCDFNVPQLLGVDEDLRILEMSIVTRPFVLDFAGAYLDVKPAFTPEIWGGVGGEEAGGVWGAVADCEEDFGCV